MINAIRNMGVLYKESYTNLKKEEYLLVKQLPFNTIVYVLNFDLNKKKFLIYEEKYDENNFYKYLYIDAKGNETIPLPTYQYNKSKDNINLSALNRIERYFEENANNDLIQQIKELFNKNKFIEYDFAQDNNKEYKKFKKIITVKINGKYLSDIKKIDFSKIILDRFKSKLCNISGAKSEIKGGNICSLCKTPKEVYGNAKPFNFYTIDKPTFSNEIKKENSWKNFPVCLDCAKLLEYGALYLEKDFIIKIGGYNCLLIPSFIIFDNIQIKQNLINDFKRIIENYKTNIRNILPREEYILKECIEIKTISSYHFLFYEQPPATSKFIILKHVEDIIPSRISDIMKMVKKINDKYYNSIFYPKNEKDKNDFDFSVDFNFLYHYFSSGKKDYNKNIRTKTLELIYDVFHKKLINYNNLIDDFAAKIQNVIVNSQIKDNYKVFSLYNLIRNDIRLLEFLYNLEVLNMEKEDIEEIKSDNEDLNIFFREYNNFYNKPEKIICFLTGILFGKTLKIQSANRDGATPFIKNIKSMNIDENDIKKLNYQTREKIEEFKSVSKEILEIFKILNLEWPKCDDKWTISKNETRFFFTNGWTLVDKFLPSK